jgi:hypothetical protein
VSRPALGPTQPPVQWIPRVLNTGVKRGRGVTLTTHRHLVHLRRYSHNYYNNTTTTIIHTTTTITISNTSTINNYTIIEIIIIVIIIVIIITVIIIIIIIVAVFVVMVFVLVRFDTGLPTEGTLRKLLLIGYLYLKIITRTIVEI